jgi:hypothetical protein
MKNTIRLFALIMAASLFLYACSKDDPKPTTGKLLGQVTDAMSAEALEGVRVIIFNADDNAPTGTILTSDASGNFTTDLTPGNYFIKLYKQGYEAVPPSGMDAVPFSIALSVTSDQSAEMFPIESVNIGFISGKVTGATGGVLVVAEDDVNNTAYSSVSGADGTYAIYNVPAGSYSVRGYAASYSSNSVDASVTTDTETTNVDITLTSGATGTLSGIVRNLAASNKDVDVSLVHPITKETIPGLTTQSVTQAYSISNIPDGTYIARATFKNDERVMDPDRIAKFGEPVVTFTGNTIDLTFDITGSIPLETPTNDATTNEPVEITTTTPTFTWTAYSSTSDYVIEVIDASTGAVVWGGFDTTGDLPVKNIVIPSSQKSIVFNADGNASISELVAGKVYRWRVFASKDDQNSATGWTLISASEDQQGLMKIVL